MWVAVTGEARSIFTAQTNTQAIRAVHLLPVHAPSARANQRGLDSLWSTIPAVGTGTIPAKNSPQTKNISDLRIRLTLRITGIKLPYTG